MIALLFTSSSDELHKIYKMIFDSKSTIEEMNQAYLILQSWKVRRSHETLNGIMCTLSLLDVHLKDVTGKITDPFTLSTLYASTLTKFINYATSFEQHKATMYRSAERLGIDSFLIDLRHLCAHGKQLPNLEVFRKSHKYCLNWIKIFFWDAELNNVTDANIKDIRYDKDFADQLKELLTFYDVLAEISHNSIVQFDDLLQGDKARDRWPNIDKFMKDWKMKSFRHGFKTLTTVLQKLIKSEAMAASPQTFFHEMFDRCQFFMSCTNVLETTTRDSSDDDIETDSSDESPAKRSRSEPSSVVNLFQDIVWQIAKHDHLKLFLDMLYQLSVNENEDATRRSSARFWLSISLSSFNYYQKYCQFSQDAILQKKITAGVKKVYSYQLDVDLTKVFIFVGTQLLPSSLKYSKDFFMQVLNSVDEDSEEICYKLLPFVYPPMSKKQIETISDLIKVNTSSSRKTQDEDKIYTVEDLIAAESMKTEVEDEDSELIWKKSTDNIDWSSQPIGMDFSFKF